MLDRLSDEPSTERAGASPVGPSGNRRDCASDSTLDTIEVPAEKLSPPPPKLWARIEAQLRREGIIRHPGL